MAEHSRPKDGVASLAYVGASRFTEQDLANRDGRVKPGHDEL